jgi:hypothetical protein
LPEILLQKYRIGLQWYVLIAGGIMLLTLALIIAALWVVGLLAHIAAGFVNFLLAAAIVLAVAHFMGRRTHTI